jgi:putative transposase
MKPEHSIATLCAAFDVSVSGYHAWAHALPSERRQTDEALADRIRGIHAAHKGRYGVPRTTDSAHQHPVARNRLAEASKPSGPNQVWVADLTYVPTGAGWLYVAVILDLWSRRVVGWATANTLATSTALAALRMALQHRQPSLGLLHHSDRGVPYASVEYREWLKNSGIQASMSRDGKPYDNAAMESFMGTYKRECVRLAQRQGGYADHAEAAADFFEYVECYYNRQRRHSALDYQTPLNFENNLN